MVGINLKGKRKKRDLLHGENYNINEILTIEI